MGRTPVEVRERMRGGKVERGAAILDPGPLKYNDDVKVSFELLLQRSATGPGTKAQ